MLLTPEGKNAETIGYAGVADRFGPKGIMRMLRDEVPNSFCEADRDLRKDDKKHREENTNGWALPFPLYVANHFA